MYHNLLTDASHGPGILLRGWKCLAYTTQRVQYPNRATNSHKSEEIERRLFKGMDKDDIVD